MKDIDLVFESLVEELKIMITNISDIGIDTKKYKEKLNNIINDVHSNVEESKEKWGNNANMFLETDYYPGIKKLNRLKLELNEYNIYFKAVNTCKYLILELDDIENLKDDEKINNYVETIIELLIDIKNSNIIYNKRKKTILKEVYDIVYKIIKLEIIKFGKSRVYEYVKDYGIDTSFLEKYVRKDIENLNLDNEKYENIQKKVYEINSDGLTSNYFDIDLIKLLIKYSDNIDSKEEIVNELKNLKNRLNDIAETYNEALFKCNNCLSKSKRILMDLKKYRKRILMRFTYTIVSLGIFVVGLFSTNYLIKKLCTKQVYPKTTTTYSNEYGKEILDGYSLVGNNEQDKTYIKVYGDLIDGIGEDIREIYTYDVSNVYLDNIEDYLNLDYLKLDYDKQTVMIKQGDYSKTNGYVEVKQTMIDRTKEESYLDKELYQVDSILSYILYILLIVIFENIVYIASRGEGYFGIFTNMSQLLKYNIGEYNKYKVKHRKELQECKCYLNSMLEELSKYEELKVRFDELYNQNKYLLDDPEELLSKIDSLSQELSKEDIKGKLRSLKRY